MRLHLGCGPRFIKGFTHIDAVEYPHVDLVHAVDYLPMVQDNSAEVIYACHILEHFHKREAQRVLAEWRRILMPGGTLRLAVPDFAALVELYNKTKKLEHVIGSLFGNGNILYNVHHTTYDFSTLETVLLTAGFSNIHRYDYRTTDHADTDDYSQAFFPHLDKQNGMLLSLNVEATK